MPHILTIEIIGAIIKLKEVIGMITFISRHIALLFLNKRENFPHLKERG